MMKLHRGKPGGLSLHVPSNLGRNAWLRLGAGKSERTRKEPVSAGIITERPNHENSHTHLGSPDGACVIGAEGSRLEDPLTTNASASSGREMWQPESEAPWNRPDFLPLKPDSSPYGYIHEGHQRSTSRQGLIDLCTVGGSREFSLVWTPEFERMTSPYEVEYLRPALQEHDETAALRSMRWTLLIVTFIAVIKHEYFINGTPRQRQMALILVLTFGVLPLVQGFFTFRSSKYSDPARLHLAIASERFARWLSQQSKPATWMLVAIIGVTFIAQVFAGMKTAVATAGLIKTQFGPGEWYRLLTAEFLHGSPLHLGMNMAALISLGLLVEALAGAGTLALVFLTSAISGSLFSVLFSSQTSVGASGGIMGLLGFLFVLGMTFRTDLPPRFAYRVLFGLAMTGVLGLFAIDLIDNAAHLGGALGGMAIGWAMLPSANRQLPLAPGSITRILGSLSLVVLLVAALATILALFRAAG